MSKKFDIIVIGSGPGGYVAALKAAMEGANTALIEAREYGGTCLNRGCIPSKAYLAAAELLHDVRHRAPDLGLKLDMQGDVDWPALLKRKNKILDGQRKGLKFLFDKRNITVFNGYGSFAGPKTVDIALNDGGTTQIEGEKIIIAAGSEPIRIPGWPVSERVVTSDEALDWETLPKSLIIIGGGVIGCEFACMMAEFGVETTIVELLPNLITGLDTELADALQKVFEKRGIKIFLETKVESLDDSGKDVTATLSNGEKITVERVLCSVGRRANTEKLGLDQAGVATERGFVPVNDKLETNVPGVYAIGDVNGRIQLAHAASAQAHIAVENALGAGHESKAPVPWCVYTFPEVSGVGKSEVQLTEAGTPFSVGKYPFSGSGKAQAYGDSFGFVKVLRHRETDVILGIHAIGHGATEFIAAAGVILHTRATASEVEGMVFAHPTMSEGVHEAVEGSMFSAVHLPPAKMVKLKA